MSRHSIVLEKTASQVTLFNQIDLGHELPRVPQAEDIYSNLAANLFETSVSRHVIGFVSVKSGEGVTYVVKGLASSLIRSGKRVAVLNGTLCSVPSAGDARMTDMLAIVGTPLVSEPASSRPDVAALQLHHDYVLVDCGSFDTSAGLTRLASVCDGIVLVAEAGRLSEHSVNRAARAVRQAQGKLLGIVLNKRRYPIPAWLHKLL